MNDSLKQSIERATLKPSRRIFCITFKKRKTDILLLRSLDYAQDGVIVTDAQREGNPIIYANPAAEHQSGISIAEMIGQNPRIFKGKDSNPILVEEIKIAIKEGKGFEGELEIERKEEVIIGMILPFLPCTMKTMN